DAIAAPAAKGAVTGTRGGATPKAALKRSPPDPGAAQPRTPPAIGGKYAVSPRSTCFGSSFVLGGGGSSYTLTAQNLNLGHVTYSDKTGAVFGDVACTRGGHVRMTGTANDLQLQNV